MDWISKNTLDNYKIIENRHKKLKRKIREKYLRHGSMMLPTKVVYGFTTLGKEQEVKLSSEVHVLCGP